MQINLSEETIKTLCNELKEQKAFLTNLLCNERDDEKEKKYRNRLIKVTNALQVFEELSQ